MPQTSKPDAFSPYNKERVTSPHIFFLKKYSAETTVSHKNI